MFSMKSKPKSTLRKDRNDDLSVLTSIQRYRRQPLPQVGGKNARVRGRSNSTFPPASSLANPNMQLEDKENTTAGSSFSLFQKNPSKTYTDPRTGRVTISCVPNLVTASQTRYILQTIPTNASANHSQLQKDSGNRSDHCVARPVSRNSRSTWAIFSTEPVTRAQATGTVSSEDSQGRSLINGSKDNSFPSQASGRASGTAPALQHTIVKPRLSFNSQNVSWASASVVGNSSSSSVGGNTFVQGSWVERNSTCNKALTNPNVTRQYSIAELMDILCGVAPIPDSRMFYQDGQDRGGNSVTGLEVLNAQMDTNTGPGDELGLWADERVSSIPIPINRDEPFKRKLLEDFENARMDNPFVKPMRIKPRVCRELFSDDLDSGNRVDTTISDNGGGLGNILENYCSMSYDFMDEEGDNDNNLLGEDCSEWNPFREDPTA